MHVFDDIAPLRAYLQKERDAGKTIGFVPTMGYLHEGHLSLMRRAKEEADVLVASIFVNPSQFAPHEDFETYPRDMERDQELLTEIGCEVLFTPTRELMYPKGYMAWIDMGKINYRLCGKSRPHFFRGVATIVNKLFNIVQPDVAVFGQKDAQQGIIIQRMVADLNMPVEVIIGPIIREEDGVAMSSRNAYLTDEEREVARRIPQSLDLAEKLLLAGIHGKNEILGRMRKLLESDSRIEVDYVEMVDGRTLADFYDPHGRQVLVAVAIFIGQTRLIDNLLLDVPPLEG